MRKIKVCVFTTVHGPFDDRIFYKECKTIAAAGYEVVLIVQHSHSEVVDGISIVALPKTKNRMRRMSLTILRAFWLALKQRAAIYHFHDPELLPAGVLLRLCTSSKIIYDVHEDYRKQILYKAYYPAVIRKTLAVSTKLMEYMSSFFFAGIVTATDDIKNNFSYHRKSISIKNYPVLSYFTEKGTDAGESTDVFRLVYTGALSEKRGIYEMIRSLEYIDRPLKLGLYGDFESEHVENNVRALKGFAKVEHFGRVEHKRVIQSLLRYDAGLVCLHPTENYKTALPVKLFEYMAVGLPVIASDFSLWKEIIEGSKCGICVDPLDPEEIARAIRFLMGNTEERRKMGARGRVAVLESYNWEREGNKLINLYNEVLADDNKTLGAAGPRTIR